MTKTVVYCFSIGDGGVGDAIKFFMYALMLCKKYNITIRYFQQGILLEQYIKLRDPTIYISKDELKPTRLISEDQFPNLIDDGFYNIVTPYTFYSTFSYDLIDIPISDVFYFSSEIIENSNKIAQNLKDYTSIHLRMGDKYLETDIAYIQCPNDIREFNEKALFKYIEENSNSTLLFCCDNQTYKQTIHSKYPFVHTLDISIGHTGLHNTTETQIRDTVTEFYILTNSKQIIAASQSGFSIVASKFKQTPIIYI